MTRITVILILVLLFPTQLLSQGETSNWYFGNGAGITFNNDGSVSPVTNGKISTYEGCATISNSFGALLFYTDGITVYNQDHMVMENGSNLYGDSSSTQSAIIVPQPGTTNLFLIFTVDTSTRENDPDRGLNYSVVNMSLNNGKGAVTEKNVSLLADCSEKIAAVVKDCGDQSIWVITLASVNGNSNIFNTYHAFEVNTTGVIQESIKSTISGLSIEDPRGYLKISPDGTKLASANMEEGLYLYDFDAKTGIVSKQQRITISDSNKAAYGIEFSPNSQYLYTHASLDIFENTGNSSSLLQYDLFASNISQSQEIIDKRGIYRGALQLGANGKIYRTTASNYFNGSAFLSVINNPNQRGAASNYEHEVISLNGKRATQGLPPFIQSFFNKVGLLVNQDGSTSSTLEICEDESFTLEAEVIANGIYSWKKDGDPLNTSGNILKVAAATPEASGSYSVSITTNNPADCPIEGEALIRVVPVPDSDRFVLEQCDVDENPTDGIALINLNEVIQYAGVTINFYATKQDQTNGNPIASPEKFMNTEPFSQTIFYDAVNDLGCTSFGELVLIVNTNPVVTHPENPILLCANSNDLNTLEGLLDLEAFAKSQYPEIDVAFYENLTDATLEENKLAKKITTTNRSIYARIESNNQCQQIEQHNIVVKPLPEILLEPSYQICSDGEPLRINAPAGFNTYTWYKINNQSIEEISTESTASITEGGTYSLEVSLNYQNNNASLNCFSSFDFEVFVSNKAIFEEITISDFSRNNTISVSTIGDGNYEYSLDAITFQNKTLFENVSPGFYTVYARDKNGCGISEEDTAVIGFPKFFSPNGDGINDTWQLIGASKKFDKGTISIHDRYGKLIKQFTIEDKGWDGTVNGNQLPASDYWFRLTIEGRIPINGHFSLKR